MRTPRLPGVSTMSALALCALLTAWLGLWGPIKLERIKDWQPLMASLVALSGGMLAYRGAMAKIDADRDREFREFNRKRMGLCLRVRSALEGINVEAQAKHHIVEVEMGPVGPAWLAGFDFDKSEELEEAWKNLDLLPVAVSVEIDQIRHLLARFTMLIAVFEVEHQISNFRYLHRAADNLIEISQSAIAKINVEIARIGSE
jgi:hypothetical protein